MVNGRSGRERTGFLLGLAVLFLALFLLCRLFPLTGDDWSREALGAALHSPLDLFREVVGRWTTISGRALGNLLAYAAGSRPLLRELMRAGFTLALIALLAAVTRMASWRGLLLWTAAALALPRAMFCQIYPWAAGFFNYVPPVVLLLASLLLVRPVLEGGELRQTPVRTAILFLLGFGQQLFMENNTLYALWAALVLLVWYRLERRRWSPALLVFFLGCALGAALLFASPSYRLVGGEGSAYQSGLSGGAAGLIAAARENLFPVVQSLILDCPVLYLSLTALALLLGRSKSGLPHRLLALGLTASCLWLAWGERLPLAAALVWTLFLVPALMLWLPDRACRGWVLFLLLSAAVAAAPLLFVSPIGPRCLFLSYVLLLAAAGTALQALEPGRLPSLISGAIPAALAAAVLAVCFSVYLPLHQVELRRTRLLEEALASGVLEAAIPAYDHGGWLWDADNAPKMERYYYRNTPRDLTILFIYGPQ